MDKQFSDEAAAYDQRLDAILAAMTAPGEQFETVETEKDGVAHLVYKNAPPHVAGFYAFAHNFSDDDFIVYEGERYSFGQTLACAQAFAAYLQQDLGVQKGDRVIIAMRNMPEWVFAFMAITLIGAVAVPLNSWWQGEELDFAARDSGAAVAITDLERAKRFASEGSEIALHVVRSGGQEIPATAQVLSTDIFEAGRTPNPIDIQPDDDVSVLYTSGSTGRPKGAVSTQRALTHAMMNFAIYVLSMKTANGEPAQGVPTAVLLSVPLFHVTGLIPVGLMCFLAGRKLVMMHRWDAERALELIEKEKITDFVGVPTMSLELLQHPKRDAFDTSSLTDLGAGGAARPAEHVHRLKDAFPHAAPGIGYGLTETNAVGCTISRVHYLNRPGSTGRATKPGSDIKIISDDGGRLPAGEVGEVCLKSAANVRGYWNRPEETAAAFTPDGWFKTGDLGYLDEDGFLFIVDRKKDIIIRGGENISCLEVEAALFKHPSVAEASVFGIPDDRLGEVVGAVIYLRDGEAASTDLLQAYVAEHLAAFKVPSQIWLQAEALPKLGSGKIDKRALRERYL